MYKKELLLSFPIWTFIYFPTSWQWLKYRVQCWTEVVRVIILVLVLLLEEKHSDFLH